MTNALKITTPTDREILITRSFDAPRKLVYEAMTKPEFIKRWLFLPPGWEMAVCEEDVRVGGKYRWAWNGPDGKPAMSMHGEYREVSPPERLVRTETFEFGCEHQAGQQIATMTLRESAGRTTVHINVLYPSKEARDGALASGMEQGMSIGYDNLEEMLMAAAK